MSLIKYDKVPQYLTKIVNPLELRKERLVARRRKYDALLKQISFSQNELRPDDRKYKYDEMMPSLFFFKFLSRRNDSKRAPSNNFFRLKLWVPDTILTSEKDNSPMWIYSSPDGYVYRTDNFSGKNILNKLGNNASPDELVAIVKKVLIYISSN